MPNGIIAAIEETDNYQVQQSCVSQVSVVGGDMLKRRPGVSAYQSNVLQLAEHLFIAVLLCPPVRAPVGPEQGGEGGSVRRA